MRIWGFWGGFRPGRAEFGLRDREMPLSDRVLRLSRSGRSSALLNSTMTTTVYRHQIADDITTAATAMHAIFGGTGSS
jgi:hypothetical protein